MTQTNDLISIVVPVYGCSTALIELYKRLRDTLTKLTSSFEIIFINDSSPDNAWDIIELLTAKDKKVKGIKLSRNFGQHNAITAGLECAKGDWVVVMDCDLQDQPEEIEKLYSKALEGYDIVLGQRVDRKDKYFKRITSKLFYRLFSFLTDTEQDASVANFGIYHRKVVHAILSMGDVVRYLPTLVQWVGYRKTKIPIHHSTRLEGNSAYTLKRLIKLAFDNIIAFSDKPLRLTVSFGIIVATIAGLIGVITVVRYMAGAIHVTGYTSLVISIWFLTGILISILGVLGIYLGKMFEKIKDRPLYYIDQKRNLDDSKT